MRDPVQRVWSYYQMVKGSKNQPYNNFSQQGLEIFLEIVGKREIWCADIFLET